MKTDENEISTPLGSSPSPQRRIPVNNSSMLKLSPTTPVGKSKETSLQINSDTEVKKSSDGLIKDPTSVETSPQVRKKRFGIF